MTNLSLVSVYIPSYNHEKYVSDSIKSVLNQTYKNIELIVIDDGSKDNSVSIIKNLADKYGFKFIHRPNKGLCATINQAINLANGKYICGCASDDVLRLDSIEKRVEFMEKNPNYAMVYGEAIYLRDDDKQIYITKNAKKSGFIFDDLFRSNFIPAGSVMVRKEVFESIGKYDENLKIEDYDMWLRIADKFQIGYINEILYYYRPHENQISNKTFLMYENEKQIFYKWQHKDCFKNIIKRHKLDWFNKLAKNHKKESLKNISGAVLYNPFHKVFLKGLAKLLFYWGK